MILFHPPEAPSASPEEENSGDGDVERNGGNGDTADDEENPSEDIFEQE